MKQSRFSLDLPTFVKNVDMFGAPIPTFNLGGISQVQTSCGALVSMIIMGLVFMFSLMKLEGLLMKKRPDVVSFVDEEAVPSDFLYNTRDEPFMMAFSAENW